MCIWNRFVYECGHPAPYLEVDIECNTVGRAQIQLYQVIEGFPEGLECPPKLHTTHDKRSKGICLNCMEIDEKDQSWKENGQAKEAQQDEKEGQHAQEAGSTPEDARCKQEAGDDSHEAPNDEQQQQYVRGDELYTDWTYLGCTGSYT